MRRTSGAGFTIIELLIVVALAGILMAMAVPQLSGAMRRYSLNSAAEIVTGELRNARFTAVARSRTVRVRFNCPGPGQFRIVEVVNDPAINNDADRCSETAYPFPDPDPETAPNADGPAIWLSQGARFGDTVQDVQFTPLGRAERLTGCPSCMVAPAPANIEVTNGNEIRTITITASGLVRIP